MPNYSTWMADNAGYLQNRRLRDVTIPGTHDTGTYAYNGMPKPSWVTAADLLAALAGLGLGGPLLAALGSKTPDAIWDIVMLYTITQDRSISEQLNDGIRYLDIRTQNDGGQMYIHHGGIPHNPKKVVGNGSGNDRGVVQDVADFLRGKPKEVVILDFQDFKDMDTSSYRTLLQSLNSDLGSMLVGPRIGNIATLGTRMADIWARSQGNNGLAIAIIDPSELNELQATGLWDPAKFWNRGEYVYSPWANSDDTDVLRNFLYMESPGTAENQGFLSILQGQLTTITHANLRSLKSAAAKSNPKLMGWLQSGELGSVWNAMIVDFYNHGINYVATAISLNVNGWPQSGDNDRFWAGNVKLKQLSDANKQIGIDPESDHSPTAAALGDKLFTFYKGHKSDRLYMAWQDGAIWRGNQKVSQVPDQIEDAPGAAPAGNMLLVVYKLENHSHMRSILTNGESTTNQISTNIKSDRSPALCSFSQGGQDKILMAYKDDDSNDLKYAIYDVRSRRWDDRGKIKNHSHIDPKSNYASALAPFGGKIFMLYKGAHSNTIYQAIWDPSRDQWSGNSKIKDTPNTSIDPESNRNPAVAFYEDSIYMLYKGAHTDNIYQSRYDGTKWHGDDRIEQQGGDSDIDPDTNKTPALATVGSVLWMVYKGAHSNNLYLAGKAHFHRLRK